jgi:hypothetical protein
MHENERDEHNALEMEIDIDQIPLLTPEQEVVVLAGQIRDAGLSAPLFERAAATVPAPLDSEPADRLVPNNPRLLALLARLGVAPVDVSPGYSVQWVAPMSSGHRVLKARFEVDPTGTAVAVQVVFHDFRQTVIVFDLLGRVSRFETAVGVDPEAQLGAVVEAVLADFAWARTHLNRVQ